MKGGRGAAPLKNGVTGVLRVTRGLNYLNLHNIKPVTQFLFCMCIKCYKSNLCNALPASRLPPPASRLPGTVWCRGAFMGSLCVGLDVRAFI